MTATIKEFCRINGIDEASPFLAEMIFEALIGGENAVSGKHSAEREKGQTPIPHGAARKTDC